MTNTTSNQDVLEGAIRLVMTVIVGALLFGWRGAIACPMIFLLIKGLLQDMVNAHVAIARAIVKAQKPMSPLAQMAGIALGKKEE